MASFLHVQSALEVNSNEFLVLISFREWLHSYTLFEYDTSEITVPAFSSLSESGFIPTMIDIYLEPDGGMLFSSLSESGFIPTNIGASFFKPHIRGGSHLFQRVASFLRR